jgi:hypothetical protein
MSALFQKPFPLYMYFKNCFTFFISSDMKSASNLLSREFLSDVNLCCRESVDDDTSGLISYLLQNRGWMILKVLSYTGVEVSLFTFSLYLLRLPPTAVRMNHERLPRHCIYRATSSMTSRDQIWHILNIA